MRTLTQTEDEIYELMSVGIPAKEIAGIKKISIHTVHVHIKNIKNKIGLYKTAELIANYYCHKAGNSFDEHKKEVLSGFMALVVILSTGACMTPNRQIRRYRGLTSIRTRQTEYYLDNTSIV